MTVLIKRYANRKLYNTAISRYITLKGIAELIDQGEEVRVIDNETGEDITSITLSQILVDNERGGRAMPRSLLSNLIQRSGDALYSALKRSVEDATGGIGEIQRNVKRAIHSHEEDAKRLRNVWSGARTELDELVQGAVERVFRALDLPRRSDVEVLNANLERVADALERLGKPAGDAAATESAGEEMQAPES
jgi:polyhydroxyalkanoate synthesis repressor PhaR